jgi:hypothetical protein
MLSLTCDGQSITIPPFIEGIVLLNIPSTADGTNPWSRGWLDGRERDDHNLVVDEQCGNIEKESFNENQSILAKEKVEEENYDFSHSLHHKHEKSHSENSITKSGTHTSPQIDDGRLEVIGLRSSIHLAAIQSGATGAVRLSQATHVVIQMAQCLPLHIDGESLYMEGPCVLRISLSGMAVLLSAPAGYC